MNVVCGQCGTGYEFDDALVSDRGTTVRCTQCGFQFRVHSSRGPTNSPERWIVRKVTGEEYIFRSLSELQRAIAQRRVLITDSLSRDGSTFRPLQQLSELDSFFSPQAQNAVAAESAAADGGKAWSKKPGPLASKAPGAAAVPRPRAGVAQPAPANPVPNSKASNTNAFDEHTPRGGFTTQSPGGLPAGARIPVGTQAGIGGPPIQPAATPGNFGPPGPPRPDAPPYGAVHAPPVGNVTGPNAHSAGIQGGTLPAVVSSPMPVQLPYAPTLESERLSSGPPSDERPTPTGALPRRRRLLRTTGEDNTLNSNRMPSAPHLLESLTAPPRRRFGGPRWIVAVVLLGGGVLVAATVGRSYFASFRRQDAVSDSVDPRVATFLKTGDEAFADGDLEEARAQFEKASALVESVDIMQRLLSVDVFRADGDWLQLKVIPTESSDRPPIEAAFRERCTKVQSRVSQLQKVSAGAPVSTSATLAIIDALRVLGQVQAARSLIERSSGLGDAPREAYVSAMLDVSEPGPNWEAIIARLKGAAAAERGAARAQAALVYALIGSRDFAQAQQELEVLRARKRQHPATLVLERYLRELQQAAPRASAASEPGPASSAIEVEARDAPSREGPGKSADPMAEAAQARAAGELARAARLYSQALSQEPGNVGAMTGLGDVARSQGNTDIALSHYGAALRANPNHVPAILACADLKWSLGDRAGAVDLYRRLSDGPPRVQERVREFEKAEAKAPTVQTVPAEQSSELVKSPEGPGPAAEPQSPPSELSASAPASEGAVPVPGPPTPETPADIQLK
jgi:predicted Zn finger-like uncharacterized protein